MLMEDYFKFHIGYTITAKVEVSEIRGYLNRVRPKTICFDQSEKIILSGEALVSPPEIQKSK